LTSRFILIFAREPPAPAYPLCARNMDKIEIKQATLNEEWKIAWGKAK
jgi:hypothetical protein